MKVIFLDVDGVLNSEKTLMSNNSLENELILNLKTLVEETGAKIVLTSSWRFHFSSLRKLMEKLDEFNLHISDMTPNGVPVKWINKQGFRPSKRYLDTFEDENGNDVEVTMDRGAEILKWLSKKDVNSFVVLDDDAFDILAYVDDNFVKTNFATGLTKEDVEKAIEILSKEN